MRRTTITLPDDLAAALEREARRRRTSCSEIVREALIARLPGAAGGKRVLAIAALGRSEHEDTAEHAEDVLRAGWLKRIESDG